jgi:hypothetical protein
MQSNLNMLVNRAKLDLHDAVCVAPISNAADWYRLDGCIVRMNFITDTIVDESDTGACSAVDLLIRAYSELRLAREQFADTELAMDVSVNEPWQMHVTNAIEKIKRQQIVKLGKSEVVFKYAHRALSRLTGAMAAHPAEFMLVRDYFFSQLHAALIPDPATRTSELFKDLGFQRLCRGLLLSYLMISLTVQD